MASTYGWYGRNGEDAYGGGPSQVTQRIEQFVPPGQSLQRVIFRAGCVGMGFATGGSSFPLCGIYNRVLRIFTHENGQDNGPLVLQQKPTTFDARRKSDTDPTLGQAFYNWGEPFDVDFQPRHRFSNGTDGLVVAETVFTPIVIRDPADFLWPPLTISWEMHVLFSKTNP